MSRRLSVLVLLACTVGLLEVTATAADAKPSAPGSVTGYAFDTCSAPAQEVMDAWWQESRYSAVGVYIGGDNRKCAQPELNAGWVKAR